MSRTLIITGALLILTGLLWPFLSKGPWGRLPGDILIRKDNLTFYFPIATSVVVSILLSVLLWLFRRR